jgi:hypothetical protein
MRRVVFGARAGEDVSLEPAGGRRGRKMDGKTGGLAPARSHHGVIFVTA